MTDNANRSEGVVQQAVYSGPALRMPLPGGYAWRVNTQAGGYCGPNCTDSNHMGTGYYSIDFGRYVQDNFNTQTTFGDGVVDVLAAAAGNVTAVVPSGCTQHGTTCKVEITDDAGYVEQYLHFANNTIDTTGVSLGTRVLQGQFLGKMGTTGDSDGVHLHFQVKLNNDSSSGNPGLSGLALEGIPFVNYTVGSYFRSTNNFKYTFLQSYGGNPRTCSNALLIDPITLQYTCNQWSRFNLSRTVFSDLLVESMQQNICLKADVWLNGGKVQDVPEYCTSGISPGSGLYFNNASYQTTSWGTGEIRYYARANASGTSYLPAPFAVTQFAVLDSNTPDSQPAPVNTTPGNANVVQGPSPSLGWNDASGWTTMDHDLYFWYWNGSGWSALGQISGWSPSSVTVTGLPANKYIAWEVRSCGFYGCSSWSNATYFFLQQ